MIVNDGELQMAAVPDREAEVRFALRWIKSIIVKDNIHPGQIALVTRNLEPYRKIIYQVASEFGIPVQVRGGMPLIENPAIASFFDLLKGVQSGKEQFNWRAVVEAWRSPYFCWDNLLKKENSQDSPKTHLEDTDQLVKIDLVTMEIENAFNDFPIQLLAFYGVSTGGRTTRGRRPTLRSHRTCNSLRPPFYPVAEIIREIITAAAPPQQASHTTTEMTKSTFCFSTITPMSIRVILNPLNMW